MATLTVHNLSPFLLALEKAKQAGEKRFLFEESWVEVGFAVALVEHIRELWRRSFQPVIPGGGVL